MLNTSDIPTAANSFEQDQESAPNQCQLDKAESQTDAKTSPSVMDGIFLSTPTFIAILSYCIGLIEITRLSALYYQADVMKLDTLEIQMLAAFSFTPEIFKPMIAYLMDKYLIRQIGSKSIVVLSAVIKILLFSSLIHFDVNFSFMMTIAFLKRVSHIIDTILCEYSLIMVSKNKPQENRNESKEVSTFFTFKLFGHLVGMLLGGWIIQNISIETNFYIGVIISLFLILLTFFYKESFTVEERPARSFVGEIRAVKNIATKEHLLGFFVLILFFKMTPNIKSSVELYMKETLKFSALELSITEVAVLLAEIVAIFMYTCWLRFMDKKILYVIVNGIAICAGLSFLLVVFGHTNSWRINDKILCSGLIALGKFCMELNAWPAIEAWYRVCPKNAGATSISMFTGLLVVAHNIGYYFGTALIMLSGVTKTNMENIWIPIFSQNQYLLIVLVILMSFMEFKTNTAEGDLPMVVDEEVD
jgi:hypothetical protein